MKAFIKNLVQISKVVSEKIFFFLCMYAILGQGQEMTLTFNTHTHSYIELDDCSNLTFRLLSAIVSEKSTVFTFYHRKALVTKFDLAVK